MDLFVKCQLKLHIDITLHSSLQKIPRHRSSEFPFAEYLGFQPQQYFWGYNWSHALCPTTSTLWLILCSSENCWNHTILVKLLTFVDFLYFLGALAFGRLLQCTYGLGSLSNGHTINYWYDICDVCDSAKQLFFTYLNIVVFVYILPFFCFRFCWGKETC